MNDKQRAAEILRRLGKTYPVRGPFVEWKNPLELVVGTVLSAQCTDKTVNKVTKTLFKKYRKPEDYAKADIGELEKDIYSTGFYRAKARYLQGIGRTLIEKYDGKVPNSFRKVLTLPGVAKKTAHLIMAKGFGVMSGVAVDTHVKRMAPRLGFTKSLHPDQISEDLGKIFESKDFLLANEYFIMHGRKICLGKPKCAQCVLNDLCPSRDKFL